MKTPFEFPPDRVFPTRQAKFQFKLRQLRKAKGVCQMCGKKHRKNNPVGTCGRNKARREAWLAARRAERAQAPNTGGQP